MKTPHLTPRRLQVLQAVHDITTRTGWPPTLLELAGTLSRSITTVHSHVHALAADGLMETVEHRARGRAVTEAGLEVLRTHPDTAPAMAGAGGGR